MCVHLWPFLKCGLLPFQAAGRSSLGKDETELPSVQGGNFHGTSEPTGGSPPKCFARKQC